MIDNSRKSKLSKIIGRGLLFVSRMINEHISIDDLAQSIAEDKNLINGKFDLDEVLDRIKRKHEMFRSEGIATCPNCKFTFYSHRVRKGKTVLCNGCGSTFKDGQLL